MRGAVPSGTTGAPSRGNCEHARTTRRHPNSTTGGNPRTDANRARFHKAMGCRLVLKATDTSLIGRGGAACRSGSSGPPRPEQWPDVGESIAKGRDQSAPDRMCNWAFGLDAETQSLARLAGNVQGSEQPVPDAQAAAEVLVEMDGVGRVMDLMVCRAQKQSAPDARAAGGRSGKRRPTSTRCCSRSRNEAWSCQANSSPAHRCRP
jgi:hypothetical protein